ncbi:unnamed protein product [Zymoseptoria tritici ST99CH_1A5]|uniref:Uncharacterized protein n=2 Tax=Zymoseptoria tritici TaxID=1047171 RepID=A0A1X7RW07_ZYMT9|nr:unnamed protein product [Zymoseptoria tritici ST99CH_3D7]SMY25267.1 unnamed protein product [Zymoseptoria tritici ST99CH_1A5]
MSSHFGIILLAGAGARSRRIQSVDDRTDDLSTSQFERRAKSRNPSQNDGDQSEIAKRAKSGLDFQSKGKDESMLHIAARHNRHDAVLREIKNGADVSVQNRDLQTPLHVACRHGHLKIARTLIENGAQIEVENDHGESPLQIAKSRGYVEIVRLLVLEGTLAGRARHGNPGNGLKPLCAGRK